MLWRMLWWWGVRQWGSCGEEWVGEYLFRARKVATRLSSAMIAVVCTLFGGAGGWKWDVNRLQRRK